MNVLKALIHRNIVRTRILQSRSHPRKIVHEKGYVEGCTKEWIEVLRKPDLDKLRKDLQVIYPRTFNFSNVRILKAIYDSGIRSVAVVLMHSYTFGEHEKIVGSVAASIGFEQISLSSEIMSMFRIVPRGLTACVDAYLTPLIKVSLHLSLTEGLLWHSNISETSLEALKIWRRTRLSPS